MAKPFPLTSSAGGTLTTARARVRATRGFTLTELLICIAIIAVLLAIGIPTISRVRASQRSTACSTTLRQIAVALQLYTQDNKMRFPDPGISNLSWEQMLTKYHQAPFACPADEEVFPALGSSYDWRDTGDPMTTLAGRSLAAVGRPEAILTFEALPGWHGASRINVARVDGSVTTLQEDECFQDLSRPVLAGVIATAKSNSTTTLAPPRN